MIIEEFLIELKKLLEVPAWREIWSETRIKRSTLRKDNFFGAVILWNQEQKVAKLSCFVDREFEKEILYEVVELFETYTEAIKWFMGEIETTYTDYIT